MTLAVKYSFSLTKPKKTHQEKIKDLVNVLVEMPQVDFPTKHYFAPHMCAREMTFEAGTICVGAMHRTAHLCTLAKGRLIFDTDDGPFEMVAPYTFMSEAGSQKAAYAPEESVFITYHVTDETDIDKLVEEITFMKADEIGGAPNNIQILRNAEKLKELQL